MPHAKPKAAGGRHITRDSNAEILTKDNAQLDLQILCTTKLKFSIRLPVNERRQRETRGKSEVRRNGKYQAAEMSSMNVNQGWPS